METTASFSWRVEKDTTSELEITFIWDNVLAPTDLTFLPNLVDLESPALVNWDFTLGFTGPGVEHGFENSELGGTSVNAVFLGHHINAPDPHPNEGDLFTSLGIVSNPQWFPFLEGGNFGLPLGQRSGALGQQGYKGSFEATVDHDNHKDVWTFEYDEGVVGASNGFAIDPLDFHGRITATHAPEPGSLSLLALGSGLILTHRRRQCGSFS